MEGTQNGGSASNYQEKENEKRTQSSSPSESPGPPSKQSGEHTGDPITPMESGEDQYLSGFKLFMVMFSIILVGFLVLLDTSIVSTAIPRITSDFHSLNDVGWYGTAYLLTSCAVQPLTGKIYSQFSAKWTFLSFFGIFELGSVLCGAATSSPMLIIGRAIAGLGVSGLINGVYTIINVCLPLPKVPLHVGILTAICQLGMLSGPLIGGALTQYTTWRWCFYINLPCGGVVAVVLCFVALPGRKLEASDTQTVMGILRKLDLIGFSLFAPAATQFILALQWGGTTYPWNGSIIIGLFCGAFGTMIIFLMWEYRMGDGAMIPFSIIGKRVVWCSCLNVACLMGSMLTSTYYLPIYFQAVRNASPTMSGVDLLPSILSTMLFGLISGALVSRVGYYLPFAFASGALNAIGCGLITTWTPKTAVGVWIGFQILQGGGRGLGFQMPIVAVQNNTPKTHLPIVNALVVFSQNLGGVVFLAIAQVVFSNRLRYGLTTYAPEVNTEAVIAAGATAVRGVTPAGSLPEVLMAYNKAFVKVMYVATGAAGGTFLSAFGMRWMNIKQKKAIELKLKEEA